MKKQNRKKRYKEYVTEPFKDKTCTDQLKYTNIEGADWEEKNIYQ